MHCGAMIVAAEEIQEEDLFAREGVVCGGQGARVVPPLLYGVCMEVEGHEREHRVCGARKGGSL